LILACDGVWDVLTDAEAVRIARSTRDPAKIAVRLRDTAIDRNSKDNISCLVIQLNSDRVPLSDAAPRAAESDNENEDL
jgi:serine/threonine protein phosphatase PrpC